MIILALTLYWMRVTKYIILTTLQRVSHRKLARRSRWEAQGMPMSREGQKVWELVRRSHIECPHWLRNYRDHRMKGGE